MGKFKGFAEIVWLYVKAASNGKDSEKMAEEELKQRFRNLCNSGRELALSEQQLRGIDVTVFDADAVAANKKTIQYLVGQLAAVSDTKQSFTRAELTKRNGGTLWTTSGKSVNQLCYLAQFVNAMSSYSKYEDDYAVNLFKKNITPTLSPRDPNFPAWWEAHKAKWED